MYVVFGGGKAPSRLLLALIGPYVKAEGYSQEGTSLPPSANGKSLRELRGQGWYKLILKKALKGIDL